ncbi:MAG: hypothetical protein ACPGWR_12835 [Ardenticatenaceae bacterium]
MTSYPNTIRSLNGNRTRSWLLVLIFALCLLVAWWLWFFLAQITFTEVSQNVRVVSGNIIVADFDEKALSKIRLGQAAFVYVDDEVGLPDTIPAVVADIEREEGEVQFIVEVEAISEEELSGQVEVEVEHLSPARLVLRASGLIKS